MFINFSNHPSGQWSPLQKSAASAFGDVIDIPFPAVPADSTPDEICAIADEYAGRILHMNPGAVMCQGEFTLAFAVISGLISCGVKVVAACSERKSTETEENGITKKTAYYEFQQFREYKS